jgi:hypothetical protein
MPPPEQDLGVLQQPPADLARFATPVDHRLEIPAEMGPAKLASSDPPVALEPVADDHLPAICPQQAPGDLGPP